MMANANIVLNDTQWNLLLRVAKANEAHDSPPRIKGATHGTLGVLVRLGLMEPGGRKVTERGWFYVRDEITRRGSATPTDERCGRCPHPPHNGPCYRRNGGTAYQCPCTRDTVPTAKVTP